MKTRARSGEEEVLHGLRAGLAIFARRRDDILRVAHAPAVRSEVADLSRWAGSRGIPCVERSDAELDRIAGSTHHEGLCVGVLPRGWPSIPELARRLVGARGAALALDRVRNPYNVGAVIRSAAFFGLDAVLLGAPAPHPALSPEAVRVAEGGAEWVRLARTTDLAATLARLRAAGVQVVGTDARAREDAFAFRFARPAILVVGHEREGLGERVRAECQALVAVRGAGTMDSLNVAVAAGILLAAIARAAPERRPERHPSESGA
ncbi:MAG: RNA methyltransferase, partial [Myxococcales bacterium]|nr:RNA methyltransferase [Myxococcales bacterium]